MSGDGMSLPDPLRPEDPVAAEVADLHMTVAVLALNLRAVADRLTMLQRRLG